MASTATGRRARRKPRWAGALPSLVKRDQKNRQTWKRRLCQPLACHLGGCFFSRAQNGPSECMYAKGYIYIPCDLSDGFLCFLCLSHIHGEVTQIIWLARSFAVLPCVRNDDTDDSRRRCLRRRACFCGLKNEIERMKKTLRGRS